MYICKKEQQKTNRKKNAFKNKSMSLQAKYNGNTKFNIYNR